jgi:hypothetical protein
MRSYIDNRGVYHRFIDWAKLFGRKKDVEEKVEEVAEIQESVEQYLEDKDTTAPAVADDCCDDCDGPFDDSYEYLSLDKGEDIRLCEDEFDGDALEDACEDDCPADDCDGPYVCPDVINEPDNENPCQPENPPIDNIEQLDTVNTSKPEKVVKEKSAAKKTAKKTTTKSSKSKK